MNELRIRKVAILGAGVMGAQIAAHFINAGFHTILFDLPSDSGDANAIVTAAIQRLNKLKPAPLFTPELAELLTPANYQHDLNKLKECDLIIEAIGEKMEWKNDLYVKIAPFLAENAILASNTSGLSLNKLATTLPQNTRARFCGIHFFNPPRYMHLIELTPTHETNANLLDQLEAFLVTYLGKGIVRAKDTPNFIANRIGVFSLLATLYHAEQFGIGLEVVDALTGPLIGRAKSATLRTMDVVGLDTMAHVVQTMTDNLVSDPWARYYHLPTWLQNLIAKGALGQKTGVGIFQKIKNQIQVFDIKTGEYRDATATPSDTVLAILKEKDVPTRFAKLQASNEPGAQFLWACYRDLWHYSAYHLAEIAESVRDVDLAIRYGFGWKQGPFEIWQGAGFLAMSQAIQKDISAEKTMANVALPSWCAREHVYAENGAFAPAKDQFVKRSQLPVYQRQLFPDAMLAETFDEGQTIFSNDALRFWHQNDGVGIISFKTKANTISVGVLEGIQEALRIAERDYKGVVLWQRQGDHFSVGADLSNAVHALQNGQDHQFLNMVETFQKTSIAIRDAQIPVVAAVKGYVFGGGCELSLHCDRIVAAAETYVGLVEAGVGLLPAGGGTKYFAAKASMQAPEDPLRLIQRYFKMLAMAEVSGNAQAAKSMGFLQRADRVVMHAQEILFVAKAQALALSASAYRPLMPRLIKVAGKQGIATLQMLLVNYREGGFISDYDFEVAMAIATVLCGGEIETGSMVDEAWLLQLEREYFMKLAKNSKTQERIAHTLKTGKPLRN